MLSVFETLSTDCRKKLIQNLNRQMQLQNPEFNLELLLKNFKQFCLIVSNKNPPAF